MHTGEDTANYLAKGYRVIAFEANHALVKANRARFSSEIASGRLTIVEGAIVAREEGREGVVTFFRHPNATVWGTVAANWAERKCKRGELIVETKVPTVDFPSELHRHGIPYYLKIDIEGRDIYCLSALRETAGLPSYLSMEAGVGGQDWSYVHRHLRLLKEVGYDRFLLVKQFKVTTLREPISTRQGRYGGWNFAQGDTGMFGTDLAGQWHGYRTTYFLYLVHFYSYRWLGYNTDMKRNFLQKVIRRVIYKTFNIMMPGWLDTHATTAGHIEAIRRRSAGN
ncbi:FkbM family methyltransferase [Lewinella sp. IMCC34191]|uniref:FkbM family methyltransferase n=1 Tax=Lewinella sp. IMCC34191 TaxID=2259172 RepID=UPI001300B31A|nr:FkbM family methyltransferase [Lewinella sp. IMCC34191]